MNVALIADTHMPRMAEGLPQALVEGLRAQEVALILHAGDLTDLSVVPLFEAIAPFDMVAGNNDGPEIVLRYGRQKVVTVEGVSIGLIHGDGQRGRTVDRARLAFAGEDVAAVVFGHSHEPHCEQVDGVWLLNPGSPTDKRRAPSYSYMILRVEAGRLEPILHTYSSKLSAS